MLELRKKVPRRYDGCIYAYESLGSWNYNVSINVQHNVPQDGCTTTTVVWNNHCVNTWDIVCNVGDTDSGQRTIVDC